MTYVKINEETSRKFTAQVKIKINHNTTLEQYEDIIKEAKQLHQSFTERKGNMHQSFTEKNHDEKKN